MKTLYIKIALIISFLIIIFPGEHLSAFNFLILTFSFFDIFYLDLSSKIDFETVTYSILVILINISLLLVLTKNKILNILALFAQFYWLIYLFDINFLKFWYYILPTSIYLILSLTLIYFLFLKKKKIKLLVLHN